MKFFCCEKRLSVITIVKDDPIGVEATLESLERQSISAYEQVIIDGTNGDCVRNVLLKYSHLIDVWIHEPDGGIYSAMNKGIQYASGELLLFLNAGDQIVGDLLGEIELEPGLLPVITKKANGRTKRVKKTRLLFGIPYCHQGIIFPVNRGLQFSLHYKIASDYDYTLRSRIPLRWVPRLSSSRGYIFFERGGVSDCMRDTRDQEISFINYSNSRYIKWGLFNFYKMLKNLSRRLIE